MLQDKTEGKRLAGWPQISRLQTYQGVGGHQQDSSHWSESSTSERPKISHEKEDYTPQFRFRMFYVFASSMRTTRNAL